MGDDTDYTKMSEALGDDSLKWARALTQKMRSPGFDLDEGTLHAWFANAIVTGHDVAHRRRIQQLKEDIPKVINVSRTHELLDEFLDSATSPDDYYELARDAGGPGHAIGVSGRGGVECEPTPSGPQTLQGVERATLGKKWREGQQVADEHLGEAQRCEAHSCRGAL